jgi:hypothetical protein
MKEITEIAGIVSNFATILGLITIVLVFIQIKINGSRTRAKYISELVRDFQYHLPVYQDLLTNGKYSDSKDGKFTPEVKAKICIYLGFFEKINFLLKRKVIKLESIAEMFTYPIILATSNKKIKTEILSQKNQKIQFQNIPELEKEIVKYWEKKKQKVELFNNLG